MAEPSVVVTGLGMVTPLGLTAEENWAGWLSGRSGISRLGRFDVSGHACMAAATVPEFDITPFLRIPKNQKFMNLGVKFAVRAVKEALASSLVELDRFDSTRIAMYAGSGHPGPEPSEFFPAFALSAEGGDIPDWSKLGGRPSRLIDPYFPLRSLSNAGVGLISPEINARGPSSNFVQSDAASALAIQAACDDLLADRCDLAVALGYDSLVTISTYLAFEKEGLLSPSPPEEACRPFDRRRDGVVLGEGAGALVLERRSDAEKRRAPILGEIAGVDHAIDVSDASGPLRLEPFVRLIRSQAELLGGVDLVMAHGLGTREGDCREGKVLSQVFDRTAAVSALKGGTGYLGAATGAVETGLGLLSLRERVAPAIIRCSEPDPEIPLDLVVGVPRHLDAARPRAVLVGWSLAGQCSVVSVRAAEAQ